MKKILLFLLMLCGLSANYLTAQTPAETRDLLDRGINLMNTLVDRGTAAIPSASDGQEAAAVFEKTLQSMSPDEVQLLLSSFGIQLTEEDKGRLKSSLQKYMEALYTKDVQTKPNLTQQEREQNLELIPGHRDATVENVLNYSNKLADVVTNIISFSKAL